MGSGAQALLPICFCGDLCRAFRDLRSIHGGAMNEEEEDSGSGRSDEAAEKEGLDPEIGPTQGPVTGTVLLRDVAVEALCEHLKEVAGCIIAGVETGHLPDGNLLFDMATRWKLQEDVPEGDYLSLAEVLWKEFEELRMATVGAEVVAVDEGPAEA